MEKYSKIYKEMDRSGWTCSGLVPLFEEEGEEEWSL